MTAALVNGPKYDVSFPGEPAPDAATCVAGFVFNTCWRRITSGSVIPELKSFVKVKPEGKFAIVIALATPPVHTKNDTTITSTLLINKEWVVFIFLKYIMIIIHNSISHHLYK